MARPNKTGLDYFPLDVDIASDEKVEYLEAKFGVEGFGVLIHLLAAIYREGYYINWGEMQAYVTSKRVNLPVNTISAIVSQLVNTGFFDEGLYEKFNILTSHGIQARYLQACEYRKKVPFVKLFCLLDDEERAKSSRIVLTEPPKTVKQVENTVSQVVNAEETTFHGGLPPAKTPKVKESKEYIAAAATRACAREGDQNLSEVVQAFSNNIHPVTGEIELGKLTSFLDDFGKDWTLAAITEAAENNGRSVRYIEAILERWKRDGFKAQKPKGGTRNAGRVTGDSRPHHVDTPGLRRLKEDMRWADEHQKFPWEVQSESGGSGETPAGHSAD
ncbi:MAG: DUF4373 domain-containing protein [Veillonellaceae bacterium]|nr:DUF4373 domain-containing protein [Veillonellaceae bacterium]